MLLSSIPTNNIKCDKNHLKMCIVIKSYAMGVCSCMLKLSICAMATFSLLEQWYYRTIEQVLLSAFSSSGQLQTVLLQSPYAAWLLAAVESRPYFREKRYGSGADPGPQEGRVLK